MILRTRKNKVQEPGGKVQGLGKKEPDTLYPEKGFTLIEVLVAVSILAIGLVGILRAYSTATTTMERAQYDMDAVYLLKIGMGQIEEKALTEGEIVPGVSSGEFTAAERVPLGLKRSGMWLWNKDLQKMDLPSKKSKQDLGNQKTGSDTEKKPEFCLNKLKFTVANPGRSPLREVSLETYVGTQSVKSA